MRHIMTPLTHLLDAETPTVVHDILDDAAKTWCDALVARRRRRRARDGAMRASTSRDDDCDAVGADEDDDDDANARKRAQRVERIKHNLRVETDADASAVLDACERLVRWCVEQYPSPSLGDAERVARVRASDALSSVEHDKLKTLLATRAAARCDKWRDKVTSAAAMDVRTLRAFDWAVRAPSSASAPAREREPTCYAAMRVAETTSSSANTVDIKFTVDRQALDVVVDAFAGCKAAISRVAL